MNSILKPHNQQGKSSGLLKVSPELKAIFAGVVAREEVRPKAPQPEVRPEDISPITGRPKVQRVRPEKYTKTTIKTGMMFGDLVIRRKAAPLKGAKPTLRERWHVQCLAPGVLPNSTCNKTIVVPKYYLIRKPNPKTHCGCRFETIKSRNAREYRIYMMMHQRCENPKHGSYKHYQARGITIFPEWHKSNEDGFEKWLAHVGPAPTTQHSLDRIRNAEGYYPGNLRWANAEQQRANQGDLIGGYSRDQIAELGFTEDEFVQKLIDGEI